MAESPVTRACVVCGEALLSSARVDKTTCGLACRTRLCRTRKVTRNTSATPLTVITPRSGGQASKEPVWSQTGPLAAAGGAGPVLRFPTVTESGMGPRTANLIHPDRLMRVLAEGLRSIEERRAREQTERRNRAIIVPPKTEEPSDEPAPEP
jgi:predicted nucleic acid-binding Zn ribbon protein